jgi:hypothetical protein
MRPQVGLIPVFRMEISVSKLLAVAYSLKLSESPPERFSQPFKALVFDGHCFVLQHLYEFLEVEECDVRFGSCRRRSELHINRKKIMLSVNN